MSVIDPPRRSQLNMVALNLYCIMRKQIDFSRSPGLLNRANAETLRGLMLRPDQQTWRRWYGGRVEYQAAPHGDPRKLKCAN